MVDASKLLMTQEEIETYNQSILKYEKAKIVDLSKIPLQMEAAKIIALIEQYDFGNHRYLNGTPFDEFAKQKLLAKRNLDCLRPYKMNCLRICRFSDQSQARIHDQMTNVQFGIVTVPADVRSFPTTDVLMASEDDWAFDYFQETKLKSGEGVCIYHHTADRQWLFVQAKNYAGWVKSNCIEQCSREDTFRRIGKRCYLPYTTANVMKQAFQLLNTPYSWGNKGCGLDCSGVMLSVYECFGFSLPRNTSAMAACKDLLIDVRVLSSKEKKQVLKGVLPGSMLLMNGHVVMYLGIDDDNVYALHGFSKYYDDEGNKREVMACAITTMDIKRGDGGTFLDDVHSVWEILPKTKENNIYQ